MKIPAAAIAQHIAVLGKTGSGKTYAAKGIVEGLLESRRQVCIIDPTGAWWGLRSSADGKAAGYPVLVLGGDHGDLPLPALGGEAVARLIVEQGASLIADTSHMGVGERSRWFTGFATAIYRTIKSPLHLVLDEAHVFAPQGKVPDPETGKMLHAANALASGGRSRGIRLMMITQRPAKLHKDSLTCADTLIAMRMIAPQDREAVEAWILGCGDKAKGREVLDSLANLTKGEGWAWFPEGGFLQRGTFPRITTFDSSATPEDGQAVKAPKHAAEIDLASIREALAEAVKEAEANDPKLLKAELARLRAELAKAGKAAPATIDPGERERIESQARGRALSAFVPVHKQMLLSVQDIESQVGTLRAMHSSLGTLIESAAAKQSPARPVPSLNGHAPRNGVKEHPRIIPKSIPREPSEGISRPQQKLLDALAWFECAGLNAPSRTNVAAWANVSPRSSGFEKNVSTLRTAGLISYPGEGLLALTEEGRASADSGSIPPTLAALHAAWLQSPALSGPQRKLLGILIDAYPGGLDRESLAKSADVSALSSGFEKNVSTLSGLDLVVYPSPGFVEVNRSMLFPEGLS